VATPLGTHSTRVLFSLFSSHLTRPTKQSYIMKCRKRKEEGEKRKEEVKGWNLHRLTTLPSFIYPLFHNLPLLPLCSIGQFSYSSRYDARY